MTQRPQPRAVVLVGFMGAGKTAVGQALGMRLGWAFVDLDERIVARKGRRIPEIFRDFGEAAFRELETDVLRGVIRELSSTGPGVIALGGGTFAQLRNRQILRTEQLPTVFLDAPVDELHRRCSEVPSQRPLFQTENQFRQLYEARRGGYMEAGVRVDTLGKTVEQVADEVAARLGLEGVHGFSR